MHEYEKLKQTNDVKLKKIKGLIGNSNLDALSNKINVKLEHYFESCIIDIKESNKTMNKIINILPNFAKYTIDDGGSPFVTDNVNVGSISAGFPIITDNNINNKHTIHQGFNYINTVHTNTLNMPNVVMPNNNKNDTKATKITRISSADAIPDDRVRKLSSPSKWGTQLLNRHDTANSTDDDDDDDDDNEVESEHSNDNNNNNSNNKNSNNNSSNIMDKLNAKDVGNNESDVSDLSIIPVVPPQTKHQHSDTFIIKVDNASLTDEAKQSVSMTKLAALKSASIDDDSSDDIKKKKANENEPPKPPSNLSRNSNEVIPLMPTDSERRRHGSLFRAGSKASWSLDELQNESNDMKKHLKSLIEQHTPN